MYSENFVACTITYPGKKIIIDLYKNEIQIDREAARFKHVCKVSPSHLVQI